MAAVGSPASTTPTGSASTGLTLKPVLPPNSPLPPETPPGTCLECMEAPPHPPSGGGHWNPFCCPSPPRGYLTAVGIAPPRGHQQASLC
eukprot:159351-Prorocentrum_lima.AAC.1